jgi:hypothetical protein
MARSSGNTVARHAVNTESHNSARNAGSPSGESATGAAPASSGQTVARQAVAVESRGAEADPSAARFAPPAQTSNAPRRGPDAEVARTPTVETRAGSAKQNGQMRDGTKLRTSFQGRYREALLQNGKVVLDGKPFDSPAQASMSLTPDKNDWEFWEYFDEGAGRWRMLDREWQES